MQRKKTITNAGIEVSGQTSIFDNEHHQVSASITSTTYPLKNNIQATVSVKTIEPPQFQEDGRLSLIELCQELGISTATGRNWLKLGKLTAGKDNKFTRSYLNRLRQELQDKGNSTLKTRRNKKLTSGHKIYTSYIPEYSYNITPVITIMEELYRQNLEITDDLLNLILVSAALSLICHRRQIYTSAQITEISEDLREPCLLSRYLSNQQDIGHYKRLVDALLPRDLYWTEMQIKLTPTLFRQTFVYEKNCDPLGFLYISCKCLRQRKAAGIYYTPTNVVLKLIEGISSDKNYQERNFIDPCCGTGNFLIQLPDDVPFSHIYGNDIDETAVKLARISMGLKYPDVTAESLESHLVVSNYLTGIFKLGEFDYVIGNPPWGSVFTFEEEKFIRENFVCAKEVRHPESFELFIEEGLKELTGQGVLSFVVPESILNVKSHINIRKIIMEKTCISEIQFLGNVFDGVQCPSIILKLKKNERGLNTKGMIVKTPKRTFTINKKRQVDAENLSFNLNDDEYEVIRQIQKTGTLSLKDHASFALGIVTGNNRDFLHIHKTSRNEEYILAGLDINKYAYEPGKSYIEFRPEKFQQCADESFFRAPEKLIYRFINKKLIFAYDNRKILTLNSANIIIPDHPKLNIFYVLAVLNSRIAQFYFSFVFNSVKVLRSHLENIPIPDVSPEKQLLVKQLVLKIIRKDNLEKNSAPALDKMSLSLSSAGKNLVEPQEFQKIYDEIDELIAEHYGLTKKSYNLLKTAVDNI